ncbi:HicB family toxin-antitoxin system [Mycolicibacterium sp. GF69]|uniref:HicB family toxin-antitoxin system n=1 Tax=Mycolicibacterium sp. GF69 TaxID=2267251 RepID=UPI001F0C35EC|nr:HicB family toxin-antitoxin system [Mycolicibacterium sp. GF69]
MTTTYKVEVQRDGKWWMIHIPDIDGLTQARRLNEVTDMARSLIAISTDTTFEDVDIEVASIRMDSPHFTELLGKAEDIQDRRSQLRQLEEGLRRDSREFAYYLHAEGVPVRDIGELLGVTPQRVSQLLNET